MATMTLPTFPIDGLLTCSRCGSPMTTHLYSEPRYVCQGQCSTTFRAIELYPLLLTAITSVVITEATLPDLKASFMAGWFESEHHEPAEMPSHEVIRRIAKDPNTFLARSAVTDTAELLGKFIQRIELDTNQATIRYSVPLPAGSALTGSRLQEVAIPETVTT